MKILIVEDDPQMGELIERGLSAEGYETRIAGTARQALDSLTAADLQAAVHVAARDQRYKRLLRKLKLRRGKKTFGS